VTAITLNAVIQRSLLAALALTVVAAPAVRADDGWTLPRLTVSHQEITDVTGRTVLLRGVNVNQLNDYAVNDPNLPTVVPLTGADFREMASLGFDVVQLNIAWSALEPRNCISRPVRRR
jgi:endoglycosylceramidase